MNETNCKPSTPVIFCTARHRNTAVPCKKHAELQTTMADNCQEAVIDYALPSISEQTETSRNYSHPTFDHGGVL